MLSATGFGTVKNFPGNDYLLRVLAPGAPVCVARGGDLTAEHVYRNHSSGVPHVADVQNKCLLGHCAQECPGA